MRIAIVDLGSNSFRLLCADYREGQWHYQTKRLWTTRLGARDANGLLTADSKARSLVALEEIKSYIDAWQPDVVKTIATSAMREAPNGAAFAKEIEATYQLPVAIISGEEEAKLGFLGAISIVPKDQQVGKQFITLDVGGGSSEVAVGSIQGSQWIRSYPIGAVRLQARSKEGPQRVWEESKPFWDPMPLDEKGAVCIGIGGTITSLAAIALAMKIYDPKKINGYALTRDKVETIIFSLRYMDEKERQQVPGLQPGRSDIIVPGAEIVASFMDAYDLGTIYVSDCDTMEGLASTLCP